jgi:WD40 repeat protein
MMLAALGKDNAVRVMALDTQSGLFVPHDGFANPIMSLPEHCNIYKMCFSADGSKLAVCGDDGCVRLVSLLDLASREYILGDRTISYAAFNCTGDRLAVRTAKCGIQIINLETDNIVTIPFSMPTKSPLCFSSDNRWLLFYHNEESGRTQDRCVLHKSPSKLKQEIMFVDAVTGKLHHTLNAHQGHIFGITVNPVDDFFVTCAKDCSLVSWRLSTREKIRDTEITGGSICHLLSHSSDGKKIIGCVESKTRYVHVWTSGCLELLSQIRVSYFSAALSFLDYEGNSILCGCCSLDRKSYLKLTLFDVSTGRAKQHISGYAGFAYSIPATTILL